MDFPRWFRWCLLVFAEEALVNFLGTRDMVTQFWPAVAPFLTPLGVGLGWLLCQCISSGGGPITKNGGENRPRSNKKHCGSDRQTNCDGGTRHCADFRVLNGFSGAQGGYPR